MPEGLPTAAALIEQKAVTFFSIDTDVIQSHGYKFGEGALHALKLQRPNWFHIQIIDVVEREVLAHRMDAVSKVVQEMQTAISGVQRVAVGTEVTSRPPHRSVLAELPHTAPTSGVTHRSEPLDRGAYSGAVEQTGQQSD